MMDELKTARLAALLLFASLLLFPAAFALDAPSVSSTTHPDQGSWYSEKTEDFTWSPVSGATGYSYVLDSAPDTVPDEIEGTTETIKESTETSVSYCQRLEGVWYFHIRALDGGVGGPTTHYKVQLDHTGPQSPRNVTATPFPDGRIELTWDPPSDGLSGVRDYKIYRLNEKDFDIRGAVVVAENYTGTSLTDTDQEMFENMAYFYKLVAYDNAGNWSQVSPQVFAITAKRCNLDVTLNVPEFINTPLLEITATSSPEPMQQAYIKVLPPGDANVTTLVGRTDDSSEISTTYDLSTLPNGNILVMLLANDQLLGDPCDTNKTVGYDTSDPDGQLTEPGNNETLTGLYTLTATANDTGTYKSGISQVVFLYQEGDAWKQAGSASSGSGSNFTYDWNTELTPNGRFQLKAEISDSAGNMVETGEVTITILNTGTLMTEALSAIDAAVVAKDAATAIRQVLSTRSIEAPDFYETLAHADENLSTARRYADREDYGRVGEFAAIAEQLYNDSQDRITFSTYKTDDYVYNREQLSAAFDSAGLASTYRDEADVLIKNNEVSRKLEITSVKDNNETYYVANVIIRFTNKDTNSVSVQIIEVIPKGLMQSADSFSSDFNYEVLNTDPVIRFTSNPVALNQATEIVYLLKPRLTVGEADLLISEHRINKYAAPPIILLQTTEVDSSIITPQSGFVMPGIDLGGESLPIILGAGVIVALIAIIATLLFVLTTMLKKQGKGKQTTLKIFE